LLQIAERLSTGRIAALIKQEYLTQKAGFLCIRQWKELNL
jgi:hypothetical protein